MSARFKARARARRLPTLVHRPHLELLEGRLLPGNALVGIWAYALGPGLGLFSNSQAELDTVGTGVETATRQTRRPFTPRLAEADDEAEPSGGYLPVELLPSLTQSENRFVRPAINDTEKTVPPAGHGLIGTLELPPLAAASAHGRWSWGFQADHGPTDARVDFADLGSGSDRKSVV